MVLDSLPDEDFASHNVHSVCAAAAQASLICEQTAERKALEPLG